MFELSTLFLSGVAYLGLLFVIAYLADNGYLPRKLIRHPAVYVLSLGVYATSWSFYGSVGFAQNQGYNFLTIYLGVTLAFLLTPVLLMPILKLTREYQLTSLADVFAFRYQSQLLGILVTVFMLLGSIPYLALQIRAVTESMRFLTDEITPNEIALFFCVTLILFAVLFGARHISAREKHEGLVVAIAFESVIKLIAILIAGLYAVFGVFDGFSGLDQWLTAHPEKLQALYAPVDSAQWSTLLLLSFTAAFLLPRQFHMIFTENIKPRSLSVASWGFPLFLLLLNLTIPVIMWAGQTTQPQTPADYYTLGITIHSQNHLLPLLVFIGGISAASAMMIVTTLALSAMTLNNLLLPASYPDPRVDIYSWLLWGRRILIAVIIMLGYGFYLMLEHNQGLVQLGLISFVAVVQFIPGIIGLLYWRRATRLGVITGLIGGATVWWLTLLHPLMTTPQITFAGYELSEWMHILGEDKWTFSTFWSLTVNGILFITFSLGSRPSREEIKAANACCSETLIPPGIVSSSSADDFKLRLSNVIGKEAANKQVSQALSDLSLQEDETRPAELGKLRQRIERNLSGLVGPLLARMIVDQRLEMDSSAKTALANNVRFIEQHLEQSNTKLQGLAAELDNLRRYHRQILQDLPLGVCSLGPNGEIVIWNFAMEQLTGIKRNDVIGTQLAQLPSPWDDLLSDFVASNDKHIHKKQIPLSDHVQSLNLHQASVGDPLNSDDELNDAGLVILVEDLSEIQTLEAELVHSDRLASIGRLAAGVAHEIGNPVTGIACIAQNLRDEDVINQSMREQVEQDIKQILLQTERINDIVQSLITFSHSGNVEDSTPEQVRLCDCIEDAVRLVSFSKHGKKIHINSHCNNSLRLLANKQHLSQVFVNLLSNACDASNVDDEVIIDAEADEDYLHIYIDDYGTGIPQEIIDHIFEPFYTTKKAGEGTGLGLPMVYSIMHSHGGQIKVEHREPEGTRMHLLFPVSMVINDDQ